MDLKEVAFDKGFSLSFGSSNQKRTYGFCYEIFENDVLKNQIHYEIEIHFLNDNFGHNSIFEINRKQFYINNKIPNSKIEQIAEKASQTLFPLRVKMKPNGEIEEILTNAASKKRWQTVKEDILRYYRGETISKVINKIEAVLLNDNLLKQAICQNWFFYLYFKPLYVEYTSKLRFKRIWESPVFANQFIEYGVVHTIKDRYDADDKININANGTAIDDRTIQEIMEGYKFPKKYLSEEVFETVDSKMNVDYKLYKEDRSIFSIIGTFETKITENKQQKNQVEIYHFTERSSFKPWSDTDLRESKRIFQSYQTKGKEGIIDVAAMITKQQAVTPKVERILGSPIEKSQFYIPDEPVVNKKMSFADKIKSIFKKSK